MKVVTNPFVELKVTKLSRSTRTCNSGSESVFGIIIWLHTHVVMRCSVVVYVL